MENLKTFLTEREVNGITYAGINIEAQSEKDAILLLYIHGYERYKVIGELVEEINEVVE